ncbi:ABC-type transport system involved in multi-copper enzyme maturation permease subunit [Paenibacillus forsythiae]|uniref:ABC-type transport system involved in multi-copper enzyme maturation permease subunit n=1 Tax=Paenibacillus forsythiae TaxID=365616 RepID=A0ABU3H665_9BACL|nr:ABC transporter permease subunit [Paenibacillus forsythiae]MDT3426289.1 ABC-type transport system involved in multi-copper enzyme maturation permease subunit [Paenibacillus forsythiae]
MRIIWSITWKEMLRKKVLLLTLLMTAAFLAGFWFLARAFGEQGLAQGMGESGEVLIARFANGAIIVTIGLMFGSFVLAFLAIFTSFSAIAGEAETGILQAVLSRPLPRWKWYAGRWLGYVTLGTAYALLLFVSILLITRTHAAIPLDPAAWIKSFLLFSLAVPLLVSVSMLGSGLFSAIGNGVFMTILYGTSWLGGMIERIGSGFSRDAAVMESLNRLTGVISLVIPADGLQRKAIAELFSFDELSGMVPFDVSSSGVNNFSSVPSNSFVVYAIMYTAVFFAMGIRRFKSRDL